MSPVAYVPTSGAAFLSTARATRRPQSSRMNARRAEALSSARLANWRTRCLVRAVLARDPGRRTPARQKWSPGPRGKVPNTHCEGEKPPLRLRLVVEALDSVIGDHPLQHRLEQSSVALDSSDMLGALHACLADQDPVLGERTGKKHRGCGRHDRNSRSVANWPSRPTG